MYIPHHATTSLLKRDNMGFVIPPWAIILLVMLGGGFAICCGYALFRFYYEPSDETKWASRRPEQDAYMREVRERHWHELSRRTGGAAYFQPKGDGLGHAPISPSGNSNTTYG
ncbi:hypothetical protein HBI56_045150 [Parastagonospora nodorum]|uniref:Uncharacterized protein n=2 Tax=Phaeosphaeria nodorum (strain SN15 / ATCC MYA-4574 / FGSC 10173) TaxID=321614 RepID=A0A7U2ERG2_PHANO|nr:hypothetical protein SNOG_01920 [Parastagonospora nodorum SN15]KAH3916409.1 hypothetical protein HBH56_058270 [Parastagonospora nodorum]EAT90132.1 hypothetical protein SNOG_01920 [Parastagonospora nodorum SN15]KAH3930700.1 hypothetical protein HBH54_102200 [Parastagonospora nodorum]KAH3943879.1 hypothetical protein HBH53_167200 [Parastagonospora nodorum]KAH3965305.1 hypothetical protein HBH51_151030 [Parastagonospora nodorum]